MTAHLGLHFSHEQIVRPRAGTKGRRAPD
jgi:hypothetical protein